jgi:hypothetical protein
MGCEVGNIPTYTHVEIHTGARDIAASDRWVLSLYSCGGGRKSGRIDSEQVIKQLEIKRDCNDEKEPTCEGQKKVLACAGP